MVHTKTLPPCLHPLLTLHPPASQFLEDINLYPMLTPILYDGSRKPLEEIPRRLQGGVFIPFPLNFKKYLPIYFLLS